MTGLPKLYIELADWWPVFSAPEAHDRHDFGLFSERDWLRCLDGVGFEARKVPFVHSEVEPGSCDIFVGLKPAG